MKLSLFLLAAAAAVSTSHAFMPQKYDGFTVWALNNDRNNEKLTSTTTATTTTTTASTVVAPKKQKEEGTSVVGHPKGARFAAKMRRVANKRREEAKEERKKRRIAQAKAKQQQTQKKKKKTFQKKKERKQKVASPSDDVYNRIMVDMMFDLIDTNNDGGITNDELVTYLQEEAGIDNESIRYLFTALDTNVDGSLSREELQFAFTNYETPALYRAFGLGSQTTQELYKDAIDKLRQQMRSSSTTDSSSSNNKEQEPELLIKLADFIFNIIDKDNSGEIDVEELRTHFMGQQIMDDMLYEDGDDNFEGPSEKMESILEALDLNHDGVISREEMRQGFQQYDPRTLSEALGLPVL